MATESDQPAPNLDFLRQEQRDRWLAGEQIAAENYFQQYPELFLDADTALDFLYGEICLADELGLKVRVDEYQLRYPMYAAELSRLFEVHEAIASESLHEVLTSDSDIFPHYRKLACPNCRNTISIPADGVNQTIVCNACGISFHLASDWAKPTAGPQPTRLDRYDLLEVVGRGGFGSVYRALDTQLQRTVAVKIPRSNQFATEDDECRFVLEAKNVAQLDHPGIVRVFDVGRDCEMPYIVSEFVEGITLAEQLDQRRLGLREAATLVMRVAEALEHAHKKGVVHRDVKPSNIILDDAGKPRVLDFGLAKRDATDLTLTLDGAVLGTPAYMSPEQAAGGSHSVDGRSDQYSLGVILYQLITGELPFRGNVRVLLWQVQNEEPRQPRRLNDRIPLDLETICLKTLAKDPSRRYPTAQDLADDLVRYLAGRPIHARPVGRLERAWRTCRRNPVIATTTAIAVMALVVGTLVSSILAVRARRSANEAERQAALLRQSIYGKNMNLAQHAWVAGQVPQMLEMLDATEAGDRGWEWQYWQARINEDLRTLAPQAGEVLSVASSPSGRLVAAATSSGSIFVWNVTANTVVATLVAHQGAANCLTFSSDERWLASGGDDHVIHLWSNSLENGSVSVKPIRSLVGHTAAVRCIKISKDARQLASSSDDQTIRIWNPDTGVQTRTIGRRPVTTIDLSISPSGKQLAVTTENQTVEVYDIATSTVISELKGHYGPLECVVYNPAGDKIATGGRDRTVRVWDLSGNNLSTLRGHTSSVLSIAFSPDGKRLATASQDLSARVWDAATGIELRKFQGHLDRVNSLCFLHEGRILATGSSDGKVKLWDTNIPSEVPARPLRRELIESVAFSADGRWVASASNDGSIKLWQADTGTEWLTIHHESTVAVDLAFSADSQRLAALCDDLTIRFWDIERQSPLPAISLENSSASGLAYAPDNQHLAVATLEGAWLLDQAGNRLKEFAGHQAPINSVAISSDGKWLATGSNDKSAKLWSLVSGGLVRTLEQHSDAVTRVTFSPDGLYLLTSSNRIAKLWRTVDGACIHTFSGHTGSISGQAFSPDASRIITTSADRTAKLWSSQSGDELLSIGCSEFARVCFSPDGERLVINAPSAQVQWLDIRPFSSDIKMGRSLARPIIQQFPLRQDALAIIESQRDWAGPTKEAAREFARKVAIAPSEGPLHVLNLLTIGSPECLIEAERMVTALGRIAEPSNEFRTLKAASLWRAGRAAEALEFLPEIEKIHDVSTAAICLLVRHTLALDEQADQRLVNLVRSQSASLDRLSRSYHVFFNAALNSLLMAGLQAHEQRNRQEAHRYLDFFILFQPAERIDPIVRAELLALSGRWQEASQVMLNAKFEEFDWINQANTAMLACAAGNIEAYRQRCQKLLPRHFDTVDSSAAMVIGVACMLEGDNFDDQGMLLRFAERSLRLPGAVPVMQMVLGVGQYRDKQVTRARDTLNQVSRSLDLLAPFAGSRQFELDILRLCCLNFLATIHHELGETEQVAIATKRAEELIKYLADTPPPYEGRLSPWNAACAAEIARRQLAKLSSDLSPSQP